MKVVLCVTHTYVADFLLTNVESCFSSIMSVSVYIYVYVYVYAFMLYASEHSNVSVREYSVR